MVFGELNDSEMKKKLRPGVVSYLKHIQTKDSALFDLNIDTVDPSVFVDSVGLPILNSLKDGYTELGKYLVDNGADRGALKEKGLYDIIKNLDSAIKLKKDGFIIGRRVPKEDSGYFRKKKSDNHMAMSTRFKEYQMGLFGITKNEIGMPEPTKFDYTPTEKKETSKQQPREYGEFLNEKPYDVKYLPFVSNELMKMLVHGSLKSGQVSGLLKQGMTDISNCGAPDYVVESYMNNLEYFDTQPTDETITRSDSSYKNLVKLSENLESYLRTY